MVDVARAAGVSPALVSFALNDRPGVAPGTRARILQAAADLGYRVNPVARSLRTGRTGTLGLVVRNYTNPYFLDVTAGAQRRAIGRGATLLVVDSDYSEAREHEHIARLAATRADGLAIAPVGDGGAIAHWRRDRPDTPVVVLNAAVRGHDDVMRVSPDGQSAVVQAVAHLERLGHRRIGFLMAPAGMRADHDRLVAFRGEAAARGIEGVEVEAPLTMDGAGEAAAGLLRDPNPPTAVITNSDHTAHAVYLAVREAGAVVGRDLSVVGHDDLPTSQLLDPPLTTLRVDRWALGQAVADRLLGTAEGDHIGPVELIARASTGPPAP